MLGCRNYGYHPCMMHPCLIRRAAYPPTHSTDHAWPTSVPLHSRRPRSNLSSSLSSARQPRISRRLAAPLVVLVGGCCAGRRGSDRPPDPVLPPVVIAPSGPVLPLGALLPPPSVPMHVSRYSRSTLSLAQSVLRRKRRLEVMVGS